MKQFFWFCVIIASCNYIINWLLVNGIKLCKPGSGLKMKITKHITFAKTRLHDYVWEKNMDKGMSQWKLKLQANAWMPLTKDEVAAPEWKFELGCHWKNWIFSTRAKVWKCLAYVGMSYINVCLWTWVLAALGMQGLDVGCQQNGLIIPHSPFSQHPSIKRHSLPQLTSQ